MKTIQSKMLYRRRFIKGSLAAGLFSPLATKLFNPAQAATAGAKRALFFYMPDGINPDDWHAKGTGTNFSLPDMTAPLEDIKQHCIFFKGVNMEGGFGVHPGGVHKAITANDSDNEGAFKASKGESLDFYLGKQIGGHTPFRNVHLTVMGNKRSPFFLQGSQVLGANGAISGYKKYLGALLPSPDTLRNKKAVDLVVQELRDLRRDLGQLERDKLDVHLDGLNDLEKRLNGQEFSCNTAQLQQQFDAGEITIGESHLLGTGKSPFEVELEMQLQLIAQLVACDVSRVFSLQVLQFFGQIKFKDSPVVQHASSHFGAAEKRSTHLPWFIKNRQLYTKAFGRILKKLNAIDEGERTALGNSAALFFSELGQSYNHEHSNAPFILAGGAGGKLRSGRALSFNNADHAKLLVTMANAMDVEINRFGTRGAMGPLNGVLK